MPPWALILKLPGTSRSHRVSRPTLQQSNRSLCAKPSPADRSARRPTEIARAFNAPITTYGCFSVIQLFLFFPGTLSQKNSKALVMGLILKLPEPLAPTASPVRHYSSPSGPCAPGPRPPTAAPAGLPEFGQLTRVFYYDFIKLYCSSFHKPIPAMSPHSCT